MIEEAIAQALPHDQQCPGDTRKCTCGAVARRSVLLMHVQAHVSKLTRGRP